MLNSITPHPTPSPPPPAVKSHLAEWLRVVEADELVQLELLRLAGAAGGLVSLADGRGEESEELVESAPASRRGPVRATPKLL